MSQHNVGYVPDEIRPSAPPESAVYDEVSIDSRGNSTPVVPPVYTKQTIITVQPHHQNGTNRAPRVPVPVNTAEWVSTPRNQLNALLGTDFLNGIEQLEIQQTVQLSTLLGETKSGNQYRVKVPRAETIFLASETSTACQRDILGSSRGFSLTLTDPTGQDAFKFTKTPGWGCVPGFLHKMLVDCTGPIGSIEQNFTFLGPSFTVYNNARNPLCKIYGPNMFCCCISRDTQFQIVSVDGTHQIASLIHQWDHILLDYTITLTVPAGTNVNLKGLLLGAAFLLVNLSTHIFVNEPMKQNYSGPRDEKSGLSEGIGCITYSRDDYMQRYEGKFVWNNMHGYGEYQWQPAKFNYEGQWYVNKKEGYGRFSYPSGAYFEGLYREDDRFGPGIYTDAAGYQNVGIWLSSKLIRLSRTFEPEEMIPRLAVKDEDKIRILQYRQIVKLQKDTAKHLAENLIESLMHLRNFEKNALKRASELYNPHCKDNRALWFNKPRYDETFFGNETEQFTIDVLMTEEEIRLKIAAENEEKSITTLKDLANDTTLQIHESKVVHEVIHDSVDYIRDDLNDDKHVEISNKDENKENESDYCGIKPAQIDSQIMNGTLFMGINHEEQWNIFQNSALTLPPKLYESSDVNSLPEEQLQSLSKKESSVEEFDDFGRIKIAGMQYTKKVLVTDLIAWNNSPISIEVLKHVFKHHKFEKTLSFDVSKVLAGRRGSFRQEGAHEKAAVDLLKACSDGFHKSIMGLISSQNLYPDVADSRGNTGLLFAAARDKLEVIDVLLDLGANIDAINDECLTPLSLCILRLLELIHGVSNWSDAFLPKRWISEQTVDNDFMTFKNYEQWHGRISYESLVQRTPKQMDLTPAPTKNALSEFEPEYFSNTGESGSGTNAMNAMTDNAGPIKLSDPTNQHKSIDSLLNKKHADVRDNHHISVAASQAQIQKYIFDMSPINEIFVSQRESKIGKTKRKNKIETKTTDDEKPTDRKLLSKSTKPLMELEKNNNNNNTEICAKIEKVRATISKLLQRGADPNFAQVPYPVTIMAIFTKTPCLLSELLEYGADPDITLSKVDHYFTPLLILATLQPAYENALMAKVLLKAKANPSVRADSDYRSDLMERLRQNRRAEFLDSHQGMTALHLLAVRHDMDADKNEYLETLIKAFYQYGRIESSDLYQGHSPLSLAIFEGNFAAAKAILRSKYVDVNEQLGVDLGNAMLMLESRVLQEILPPELLQKFLELLLQYGGCPFVSVNVLGEDYNQIEYGKKELIMLSNPAESTTEVKEKRKKAIASKRSKSSKISTATNFAKSMNFIETVAKEKLIRRIKANLVRGLMDLRIMLLPSENRLALLKEPLFKYAEAWMNAEDLAIIMETMNYSRSNVKELVRLFVMARIPAYEKMVPEINTLIDNETETIMNSVMPLSGPKKNVASAADYKVERASFGTETKNFDSIVVYPPETDPNSNKFKVCFECLGIHGKVLIVCPMCKQLYFCSQECNEKNFTLEANPHQCLIYYQKEWTRLERIAKILGSDPINYMLTKFENPKLYTDLEKKSGQFIEGRGKTGIKNLDDNASISTSKCKDEEFTTDLKYIGSNHAKLNIHEKDLSIKKDGIRYDSKDNSTHVTEENNFGELIENKADGDNVKTRKRQRPSLKFEVNEEGDGGEINSKFIVKGGRLLKNDIDEKNVGEMKIFSKDVHESYKNVNSKDKKIDNSNMKSKKKGDKTGHETMSNKMNGDKGYEILLEKGKKDHVSDNYKIENGGSYDRKYKETSKKGIKLHKNEVKDNSSKFKNKGSNSKWKKVDQRANYIDNRDRVQRKREDKLNKEDWIKHTDKKTNELPSHTVKSSNTKHRHVVENNIPQKYFDWLLKISNSVERNLDIDMLLLPYVVFAQGDTYFRILPGEQYSKSAGNYSLI